MLGGAMFTQKVDQAEDNKTNRVFEYLKRNFKLFVVPLFATAMVGTISYPIAVRIARSRYLFRLRNFYAIHLSIAPFLALLHSNVFACVHTLMRI